MSTSTFRLLFFFVLVLFAIAPWLIAWAPYEETMGLVQKIFYFHAPAAITMLTAAVVCGVASARFLVTRDKRSDFTALAAAELVLVFGTIVLATGPLWARKAWGVYWQWDVRLTSTLVGWMIAAAYMLLRRFGGPGSDRLAAGVALFGSANVPFIYWSVNFWRTLHPKTTVVPTLVPAMRVPFYLCWVAFTLLFILLLNARRRLEAQRTLLDELYLAQDEHGD
jgi:heme exporter protein C